MYDAGTPVHTLSTPTKRVTDDTESVDGGWSNPKDFYRKRKYQSF